MCYQLPFEFLVISRHYKDFNDGFRGMSKVRYAEDLFCYVIWPFDGKILELSSKDFSNQHIADQTECLTYLLPIFHVPVGKFRIIYVA